MRRDERKSVLENVARLERENTELRELIEAARANAARDALEETVQTRPPRKPSAVRVAAAISFGIAFGLVTLAVTLLLMPPVPGGHHERDLRGGSAGVCR
jgi:hypothetical protein